VVDDQLELGRLHDRQVGGLCALQNTAGVDARLTDRIAQARAVAHQSSVFGKVAEWICRGDFVEQASLNSPEEFAVVIKSDTVKWAKVIRAANIKAE